MPIAPGAASDLGKAETHAQTHTHTHHQSVTPNGGSLCSVVLEVGGCDGDGDTSDAGAQERQCYIVVTDLF